MKKLLLLPILALFVGLSSCDLVSQLIPDIEEELIQTYNVVIDADVTSAASDTLLVDITSDEDFTSITQYVDGYEINKITYEIVNYDAPEDLYFSGSLMAFDVDDTETVTIGSFPSFSVADAATLANEVEIEGAADAIDQLIVWLDEPGQFNVVFDYLFEDSEGSVYSFVEEDFESSFQVKLHFYVTILTGVSQE